MRRLAENAPAILAGQTVVGLNTLDGIKYFMADDSWLLIRPSGTEPVLRVYAEAHSPEAVHALLEEGATLAQMVDLELA